MNSCNIIGALALLALLLLFVAIGEVERQHRYRREWERRHDR